MVVFTTLSFMLLPESVDSTAHWAALTLESMTVVEESVPIRLVVREEPMMPRIQGGATMVDWSGLFL